MIDLKALANNLDADSNWYFLLDIIDTFYRGSMHTPNTIIIVKIPVYNYFLVCLEESTVVMTNSPLQLCPRMIPNERMGKRMLSFQ